jgi:8-oxo-dGTP diphosphatase
MQSAEITEMYGNSVRVRVCGLLVKDDTLLMVRHVGLGAEGVFWALPGGGLEFNETAGEGLQREFREETGLEVDIKDFLFVNEFKSASLHAVELFFKVEQLAGEIKKGDDPELKSQIIAEVAFLNMQAIKLLPENSVHGLFKNCGSLAEVLSLRGYIVN